MYLSFFNFSKSIVWIFFGELFEDTLLNIEYNMRYTKPGIITGLFVIKITLQIMAVNKKKKIFD